MFLMLNYTRAYVNAKSPGFSIKNAIIIIIIITIKDLVIAHSTKCHNTKVKQILVVGQILITLSRRLRIFHLVFKLYTHTHTYTHTYTNTYTHTHTHLHIHTHTYTYTYTHTYTHIHTHIYIYV